MLKYQPAEVEKSVLCLYNTLINTKDTGDKEKPHDFHTRGGKYEYIQGSQRHSHKYKTPS